MMLLNDFLTRIVGAVKEVDVGGFELYNILNPHPITLGRGFNIFIGLDDGDRFVILVLITAADLERRANITPAIGYFTSLHILELLQDIWPRAD